MVVRLPRGAPYLTQELGITHFLRIPFATTESIPQLLSSLGNVAQDPIASALPRTAWSAPDQVHFTIGGLSLKTPARIEAATQLLTEFGRVCTAKSNPRPHFHAAAKIFSEGRTDLLHLEQPPVVSLEGLRARRMQWEEKEGAKALYCCPIESQPFLAGFRSLLVDAFVAEGFIPAIRASDTDEPFLAQVMSTQALVTQVPNMKPSLIRKGKRISLSPNFDASDICPKYRSFTWTRAFPLEKLCISELRLRDISRKGTFIKTGYRDVACIPLPGVAAEQVTCGHPDDEYDPAAKWYSKPKKVTPLLIPSTPPL
ncbi:MAG: hypothetical protein LQ346_005336 [Caloplaca aetnensis]|nr:MAG: hypothetical protein LQ346_005336 [Caloplaca aetnensis]